MVVCSAEARMKLITILISLLASEATKSRLWADGTTPRGLKGLSAVLRDTIYNPIALICGVIFSASLFFPWWYAKIYENYYTINAYAFILQHNLPPEGMSFIIETPIIAVVFLITLLAGYFFLIFWGSTMEGKKGKLFTAWSGLFMLLYAAGFYGSLLFATHRINQPVTGYSYVIFSVQVDIFMTFTRAYFVAIGAGAASMLSALMHGHLSIKLHPSKSAGNDKL
jgi:hypothetical protein